MTVGPIIGLVGRALVGGAGEAVAGEAASGGVKSLLQGAASSAGSALQQPGRSASFAQGHAESTGVEMPEVRI